MDNSWNHWSPLGNSSRPTAAWLHFSWCYMRVLYQSGGFLPGIIGGVEVLSFYLVKELSHRGHEILVVSQRGSSDPLGRQAFDGLDVVKLDFNAALASRSICALRR